MVTARLQQQHVQLRTSVFVSERWRTQMTRGRLAAPQHIQRGPGKPGGVPRQRDGGHDGLGKGSCSLWVEMPWEGCGQMVRGLTWVHKWPSPGSQVSWVANRFQSPIWLSCQGPEDCPLNADIFSDDEANPQVRKVQRVAFNKNILKHASCADVTGHFQEEQACSTKPKTQRFSSPALAVQAHSWKSTLGPSFAYPTLTQHQLQEDSHNSKQPKGPSPAPAFLFLP